ncbi:uncharacterized protein LOC122522963 [Polistes fuscatus]|uniref:uncharacterized protein LOC122522963 n=1 Tax=Polistes fuscatus TaxID=30207 RepID=UPI001CA9CEC3|nr:uncharacterized protein LOC122522963 [Polistes fuscatus]
MMKYIVFMSAMACLGYSQRPPYAGSSHRYPVVFPQYTEAAVAAAAAATTSIPGQTSDIGNRINAESGSSLSATNSASSTTIKVPIDLPIDAYGDIDLINRIKTWPKEKQPFWFINWQQIQAHRGNPVSSAQVNQQSQQEQQTQNQSFYI